jgi:hypothetical protein
MSLTVAEAAAACIWRDDWKLPKGNKALWIGEHQRCDASLGWVGHDYWVEHPK